MVANIGELYAFCICLSIMPQDDRILERTLWFERKMRFDIDYFDLLQPRREVSYDRRYRSGLFHSEKCGRDIQYESALELSFAQGLEQNQHVKFYWDQPSGFHIGGADAK